jgi:polyisoprenoid-binding protein YceI
MTLDTRILVVALSASIAFGCDDPARGKSRAQVGAPLQAAPVGSAAARVFPFGPNGSKIAFVGSKVTGRHEGSFGAFAGNVTVVDGHVERSSVAVTIQTASVASDMDKLTKHLASADFFDVARFPSASFQSTSIRAGGDGGASHTVTGNLTLHGVTKSITFPATIRVLVERVEADAELSINRKDFGIDYPGKADDLIRDEVLLRLTVRAALGPADW